MRKHLLVSNKWVEQAQQRRGLVIVYFGDNSQTRGQHCTNNCEENITHDINVWSINNHHN